MKKIISLFIIIFLLLFQGIGCNNDDNDDTTSIVRIIVLGENNMLKRIGEEFDVKISVENATEVIGLNAWVTYDPAIVEVVDNDTGTPDTQVIVNDLGFLSNAQLLVSIQKDGGGNEQPGTLICGYVSVPPTPASGNGDCFNVRFRAIAQGSTNIDFAVGHLNLQDLEGDIPTQGIGDVVDVPVNATVTITVL